MTRGLAPVVGLTLAVVFVVGCTKTSPRAVYTVNYYRTHEDFQTGEDQGMRSGWRTQSGRS